MREILFRGKRTDNGEWVEGGIYVQKADDVKDEAVYIIGGSLNNVGCAYPVDPETVGQYTGLTENGKKIFEGDVVKFGDMVGIINYNTGCYCVKTNKLDWMCRNNPAVDIVLNEYPNEIEVIGNIHDNPELLKRGAK